MRLMLKLIIMLILLIQADFCKIEAISTFLEKRDQIKKWYNLNLKLLTGAWMGYVIFNQWDKLYLYLIH